MRYMLATFAAAIVTAAAFAATAPALALNLNGKWAAIANDGKGNWGAVVDKLEATAADDAIKECPGDKCQVVQKTVGRCAAYAESKNNPALWGTSIGNEINIVESQAQAACSKLAPQTCVVRGHVCGAP